MVEKTRNDMSIEVKATVLAVTVSFGILGATFSFSSFLQPEKAATPNREMRIATSPIKAETILEGGAKQGNRLFEHNCAHCHGDDARGDEGPDLHNLAKSDPRLTAIIKGGIKGEMPAFAKKFTDTDVRALIAYLRILKD
jgi:mono/diheme cytochrome c family protein